MKAPEYTYRNVLVKRRASELRDCTILRDGAIVLRLWFGRNWVRAFVVKDGHPRRRRYRPWQMVKVWDVEIVEVESEKR